MFRWTNFAEFIAQNNSIPDQVRPAAYFHERSATDCGLVGMAHGERWWRSVVCFRWSYHHPRNIWPSSAAYKHVSWLHTFQQSHLTDSTISNEYATYPEQVPSGLAWWISQLERIDAHGLMGQWLSGYQLHDYLCTLLGKPTAGLPNYKPKQADYWPTGQFQVFKYYAQNMTGYRVGSLPSADLLIVSPDVH